MEIHLSLYSLKIWKIRMPELCHEIHPNLNNTSSTHQVIQQLTIIILSGLLQILNMLLEEDSKHL